MPCRLVFNGLVVFVLALVLTAFHSGPASAAYSYSVSVAMTCAVEWVQHRFLRVADRRCVRWAMPSKKKADMEQFLAQYGVVMGRERSLPPPCPDGTDCQRWADTIGTYAGATFGEGVFRIHDAESGHLARSQIAGMFPAFSDRITPFAYDWLGRQFAVDAARAENGEQLILMFEPGTGEALEIPFGLAGFLDVALVDMTDAVVASVFFEEWESISGGETSLARTDCVGYRVPLFLGGRDDTSNLEVVDLDVYWTLTAQLYGSTRQLSVESMINSVDTDDH